jgi:hypothetical protein
LKELAGFQTTRQEGALELEMNPKRAGNLTAGSLGSCGGEKCGRIVQERGPNFDQFGLA